MSGSPDRGRKPDLSEIRDLLFADAPLRSSKPHDSWSASDPLARFERARSCLGSGNVSGAVAALERITQRDDVESRQLLQAWRGLRDLGVRPPPRDAKRVYGVVLEVNLSDGLDVLAAYADHSARFINHGGNVIVWEARDATIDRLVDDLLRVGQSIADVIGPWEGARPEPPPKHHVRINMLTPSGQHFGEGPFSTLSTDAMGGPAITAGATLMEALIEREG